MDLNEQTYVQCFNCHSNIFSKPSSDQSLMNSQICQTCLNFQSRETTSLQHNIQVMQNQVAVLGGSFAKEMILYSRKNCDYTKAQCSVELECQLEKLQRQFTDLQQVQAQLDLEINGQVSQIMKKISTVVQQAEQVRKKQKELYGLVGTKKLLHQQVKDLQIRKERLMGVSILSELYPIYFDDKYAFISREPITFDNLTPILEIIVHLMEKYDYRSFTINFSSNRLITKNGFQMLLSNAARQYTIPWLQLIVKQTILLWEHIKERSSQKTKQSYESYVLPFKIGLQPELSINGSTLKSESSYSKFIKYYTQNIKFIIQFDFKIEGKSWFRGETEGERHLIRGHEA